MNHIEHLIGLLKESDAGDTGSSAWIFSLREILTSPDIQEVPGNPQLNRVSFILNRARMRRDNSARLGLATFGLENLVPRLERLSEDEQLETYALRTASYAGSCFVWKERMIGCEFVKRGLSQTYPFAG